MSSAGKYPSRVRKPMVYHAAQSVIYRAASVQLFCFFRTNCESNKTCPKPMRVKPRRKHYTGSFQEDWFCLNKDLEMKIFKFSALIFLYTLMFSPVEILKVCLKSSEYLDAKSYFGISRHGISQLPCLLVTGCQFISIALSDRLSHVYATVPFYHCISLVNSKTNDLTSRKSRPSSFSQTVFLSGWNKSHKNRMLSQANPHMEFVIIEAVHISKEY